MPSRMPVGLNRDELTLIVAALATMRGEAEASVFNMDACPADLRDDDVIADARRVIADLQSLSDRLVTQAVYAPRDR
jgi:hypothetical protein